MQLSVKEGVWSTTFGPTKKLSFARQQASHVYLIFSVNESGCFQGFAELKSQPSASIKPSLFKATRSSPIQYCENFNVDWRVSGIQFHFKKLNGFPPNPLNENKTIMQSKNGQELIFSHGNYLVT